MARKFSFISLVFFLSVASILNPLITQATEVAYPPVRFIENKTTLFRTSSSANFSSQSTANYDFGDAVINSTYLLTAGVCAGACPVDKCGTLNVIGANLEGAPQFKIVQDNCPGSALSTGQCCYTRLSFTPTELGIANTNLIYTFSSDNLPFTQTVAGTGIPAPLGLRMELSAPSVFPDKTTGSHQVKVIAQIFSYYRTDLSGKTVQFSVEEVKFSGGHNHTGGRPLGKFSAESCITDASGTCAVTYSASEVGGMETIKGKIPDSEDSKQIKIEVPGLQSLISAQPVYRFTGKTPSHPSNHFMSSQGEAHAIGVAFDFLENFDATLGFNDASLSSGGLFDIDALWTSPHKLHREGKSIDIDQCAKSSIDSNLNDQGSCPPGWIHVDRLDLTKVCNKNDGRMMRESTYHCEF